MNKTEQTPLIEVNGLKKYFKKNGKTLHAVDDINLTIQKGTTLGVVGESGCGKSTLGRTILRLLKPTEGQVLFEGHDITKASESQMRQYRQSRILIPASIRESRWPKLSRRRSRSTACARARPNCRNV